MFRSTATWVLILSASSAIANILPADYAPDPTVTSAPELPPLELLRKQVDNRFIGYYSWSGTWTSDICDLGGTLYQTSDKYRCCATTVASCNGPIGCIDGSLIYTFTTGTVTRGTYACTEVYTDLADQSFTICNTGFLYETRGDSSPRTNVFCGVSSLNWSYFRELPETTSATPTSRSTPSSTPASTTRTSSSSTTTVGPAESTETSEPEPAPKKKSQAWIAGAVVGPIVGLALIGLALWFFLIRKKKKDNTTPVGAAPGHQSQPPTYYTGSPNVPPQQPYGSPPMQQEPAGTGFVPYGVAKHESWNPQSPHSHGSQSPVQPHSPYGPLSQTPAPPNQAWQPIQQSTSPQMLGPGYQPPHGQPVETKMSGAGEPNVYGEQNAYVPPTQHAQR